MTATPAASRTPARLVLPGSGTAEATVRVIHQPRTKRLTMALITLGAAVAAMPVVFLLPPHLLWPILALLGGAYFAHRLWRGEYYVVEFEGRCPRCDTPLELAPGARIRGRESLECYNCHRQPELILEPRS